MKLKLPPEPEGTQNISPHIFGALKWFSGRSALPAFVVL